MMQRELFKSIRACLGLLPENKALSRKIQRIWFCLPVLVGWAFLLGAPRGIIWVSYLLLAVLAICFFFNGKWGFPWAKRWLLLLGGYYGGILAGAWVLSQPWMVWVTVTERFDAVLIILLLLVVTPCLWPLLITTDMTGFPYSGDPQFFPAALLVWGCLCLAWLMGCGVRKSQSKQ